jgi:hypothetical protein
MAESRWWIFVLILIVTASVVLCIFNAITYNKIANEKMTLGDVTPEGARALMAINIIFLIFLFPLWIWYVYKLVVNDPEKRAQMYQNYSQYAYDKYTKAKEYGRDQYSRAKQYAGDQTQRLRQAATPSRWSMSPSSY